MTLEELRSRYRDQIVELAEKRGAHNIRVFGSIARGDQHPGSDIDFLVDFEPGRSLLVPSVVRLMSFPAVGLSHASRPR